MSSMAMIRMATDTNSPDKYSIRPWPKGWWGSGFCPAIWKPTKVMREEPASDKLLKASAVMAKEFSGKKQYIQSDSHAAAKHAIGLAHLGGRGVFPVFNEDFGK